MVWLNLRKVNLEYVSLLLLALFPILPYFFISLFSVLYCVLTVIEYYLHHKVRKKDFSLKGHIVNIGLFYPVLLFFSLFHGDGLAIFNRLSASFPILIFGLVWFFFSKLTLSEKELKNIFSIFFCASFVLGCLILLNAVHNAFIENLPFYDMVRISVINFPYLDLHPVYVSLYFIMSLFYLMVNFKTINKWVGTLGIIFFTVILVLIASRISIISMIIISVYHFFTIKLNKKIILAGTVIVIAMVLVLWSIKPIQLQFKEICSLEQFELPYKKFPTSPQIRLGVYRCSYDIIEKNLLFGVGTVKFQKELDECYNKYDNYERISYNTHNYYNFLLGSGGIFCLILFIVSLKKQISIALRNNSKLFFYFTIIIIVFSLTENILSRSYGVTFYLFFLTVFLSNNKTE